MVREVPLFRPCRVCGLLHRPVTRLSRRRRAAWALVELATDVVVYHHYEPGDQRWIERGIFFCHWCGRHVMVSDMRSRGGKFLWSRERVVPAPSAYRGVRCDEVESLLEEPDD